MMKTSNCEKTVLKKGTWSPEEDHKLIAYIKKYGIWNWTEMPKAAGLARSGKSCRLRWMNYLRPNIKRGNFSKEEVETIIKLHEKLGNRWSAIAAKLPGRTDNDIKNYWHTHLKKRLPTVQAKPPNDNEPYQNILGKKVQVVSTETTGFFSAYSPSPSSSSQQIDEQNINISETFEELQHFWTQPVVDGGLFGVENYSQSGFSSEVMWFEDPMLPFDFYQDVCNDLVDWLNYINPIF
ncbi:hypothetical protein UlMin_011714 [Ulmus minor]